MAYALPIYDDVISWESAIQPRKSLTIGKEMLMDYSDEISMLIIFEYPQALLEKILSGISDYEMILLDLCELDGSLVSLDMDRAGNAIIQTV